ncbi:GNAT family N-acetyltransferase [Kitasatospora sp. CB01950]|uniref:GNAT family N-acetyltransferase n=1 Tax=Kitasatospora sp. CB01950 TaxID=1703930 RepID=UPI00093A19BD|nr:GNAT family N-acetyltransferase [Kitasatospora sp. CB01950]OKJ03321.1 acetyltransferase [Kitasatospora sp. CB01950]
MNHVIRATTAEDWQRTKGLRLDALRDPVAKIAFLDTYEAASAQPDEHWQERAAGARGDMIAQQFVAERPDGGLDGSVTVLIERAGRQDVFGGPALVDQAHLVGVFVRPEQRGTGLARELFDAAITFARQLDEPRVAQVRLFVHENNARAQAFYRRMGFARSGLTVPMPGDEASVEHEMVLSVPAV